MPVTVGTATSVTVTATATTITTPVTVAGAHTANYLEIRNGLHRTNGDRAHKDHGDLVPISSVTTLPVVSTGQAWEASETSGPRPTSGGAWVRSGGLVGVVIC